MSLISIITINLNNLEGLKKTVHSVFEQDYPKIEYLIIDGNSTDGSIEFIKSQESKIDYWSAEQDGGIYDAMNKGIVKANGEYLLFLNSGDIFSYQESISKLIYDNLNYTASFHLWHPRFHMIQFEKNMEIWRNRKHYYNSLIDPNISDLKANLNKNQWGEI